MPKVIGVRFRTSPRVYYFSPADGEEYTKNAKVVVETQRGVELATVVLPEFEAEENKIVAPLKPILRLATENDIEAVSLSGDKKQEILAVAKEKVAAHGLEMKIVDCEYTVDRGKLVLYFTAEQRVDFRELVRDLASVFHNRIDLRQIGARDECKLIGTLGACGMPCCCGRFESDNEHVSIKMAKNQNLALTPNKINGMCGRLLCCLSYENKTYEEIIKRMPKHNAVVTCPDGRRGTVVSVTPLTERVRVKVGDGDSFEFVEYPLSELGGGRDKASQNGEARENAEVEPVEREKNEPEKVRESEYDYIPEPPPEHSRLGGRNKNNNRNRNKNNNNNNNNRNRQDNGSQNQNNNNGGENNNRNNNNKHKNKNRNNKFRKNKNGNNGGNNNNNGGNGNSGGGNGGAE